MLLNKRRSLLSTIVPALAATLALGNTVALGGHRGHRSDCECVQNVPCDPCQAAPGIPQAQPVPQQEGEPIYDSAPQAAGEEAIPEAVSQPMDTGTTSDFNDFDLSTGLVSNFGGGGGSSLAFSESYVAPGYIDPAKIQNRIRLRYDNAQNANKPARAGFLYPQIDANDGSIDGGRGPQGLGGLGLDIDIEEVSIYVERAFRERFSLFIDVPIRWVGPLDLSDPFTAGTQRGAGDIKTGFRWGWIDCPDEHLTFQTRVGLPTGEARKGVGTGNTTIDFSLLYDQKIGSKTWLYAELNDWQTLDAVTMSGTDVPADLASQDANILRFGIGLGYDVFDCSTSCQTRKLTFLFETVTWTVLDGVTVGIDSANPSIEDAVGDTIVNGKYGARYTRDNNSLYVGYGHNWSSERWYSDLLRLEWQHAY